MSAKAMMATILQNQLALGGMRSLTPCDHEAMIEQPVEQLRAGA